MYITQDCHNTKEKKVTAKRKDDVSFITHCNKNKKVKRERFELSVTATSMNDVGSRERQRLSSGRYILGLAFGRIRFSLVWHQVANECRESRRSM